MDENFNFVKNPDQSLFAKSLLILGIVYVVNSFLQYFSSILGAHHTLRHVFGEFTVTFGKEIKRFSQLANFAVESE